MRLTHCHTWGLTPRLSGVSQIWRKRVVSAVWSFISECMMPLPALRYCTLPRPKASCLTSRDFSMQQDCRPDEQSESVSKSLIGDNMSITHAGLVRNGTAGVAASLQRSRHKRHTLLPIESLWLSWPSTM